MTKRQAQHAATSEQLTLLAVSDLPVQFRLDQQTRQRGLAHIAAIRRQLAAKSSDTESTTATHANVYERHHEAA